MRAPLLPALVLLAACEPMPDPGSPFAPVRVAPAAAPAAAAPAPLDPLFPTEEPVVIHSSALGKTASEAAPAAAVAAPAAAAPAAAAPAAPAAVYAPPTWPVRLVATVPGAQPPRAILGLPAGGEVVVTPGAMLPEASLVVMAIGTGTVELAEVRAVGDHATVAPRTLLALQGTSVAPPPVP